MEVPKKVKRLALRHALSGLASEGRLVAFDNLEFDTPKTKKALEAFAAFEGKKVLFVSNEAPKNNLAKSIDNIIGYNYLPVAGLNVYDLLKHDVVIVAKDALNAIEERAK